MALAAPRGCLHNEAMNPLVRAARNASVGVCAIVSRRMGLVVLLSAVLLPSASAMTSRSNRLRARTVAQEQPATHAKSAKKKSAKPQSSAKPRAKTSTTAKARSKPRHAAPVPADDPIPMKRAHHGAPSQSGKRSTLLETAHHSPAHTTQPEAASAKPAPNQALTTGDFVRAASGEANPQGVSHPEELNDDQPVSVGTALRARPATEAIASTPTPAPSPSTHRVDGFGAEGVTPESSHRTLARTMAAHHAPAPHLTGEERNEITNEAVKPMVLPAVYTRGGRLVMPAPLKGSRDVLVHQNLMADTEGLERVQDDEQLEDMVSAHELARLPESSVLRLNPELPENRRYARPWTVKFASDTARAFAARFGTGLQVNSAVRTVAVQLHLMQTNGNAANVDGDTASPHLTGQAIDIGKRGMSKAQLAWMRSYLLPLMQTGKIDVEEEFHQACFHISVYRAYLPPSQRRTTQVAQVVRKTPAPEPESRYAPPAVDGEEQ